LCKLLAENRHHLKQHLRLVVQLLSQICRLHPKLLHRLVQLLQKVFRRIQQANFKPFLLLLPRLLQTKVLLNLKHQRRSKIICQAQNFKQKQHHHLVLNSSRQLPQIKLKQLPKFLLFLLLVKRRQHLNHHRCLRQNQRQLLIHRSLRQLLKTKLKLLKFLIRQPQIKKQHYLKHHLHPKLL
jgi:hypothetical protein